MKTFNILIAILLAASLIVPAASVRAQEPEITYTWTANTPNNTGTDALGTWTGDSESGEAAVWNGSMSISSPYYGGAFQAGGSYSCSGADDCLPDVVYVDVSVTASWVDQKIEGTHGVSITAGTETVNLSCSGAASITGTCSVHAAFALPITETGQSLSTQFVNMHITTSAANYSKSTTVFSYSVSITMTSDSPEPCTDAYEVVDNLVPETAINPTSETGASATLVVGQTYRLTVGGFWNDGTSAERTDAAVRFSDGSPGSGDFAPLYEIAADVETSECVQQDPDDPTRMQVIFEAVNTDLYIRVNDTVGAFANNASDAEDPISYSIDIVTAAGASGVGGCTGQFLPGAVIGTATLSATSSTGVSMYSAVGVANYPSIGSWYIVEVTGSWLNNGAGDALTDIALKHSSQSAVSWLPADLAPSNGCYDETNSTYYMQMTYATASMYFRVYDTDANFASNTGTLTLTFRAVASYDPYPSGCELQYSIGDMIENKTVQANWVNGWPLDEDLPKWDSMGGTDYYTTPVRYYMLETYGGPANLGSGLYGWDVDVTKREVYVQSSYSTQTLNSSSFTDSYGFVWLYDAPTPDQNWHVYTYPGDGLAWYDAHTSPFVECVSQTDAAGHVRIFFAMEEHTDLYEFVKNRYALRIRDADGSWTNNTGSIQYRLYEATKLQYTAPGTTPEADGCLYYSHELTALQTITLDGEDDDGGRVTAPLLNNQIYAFVVSSGPWTDDGVNSYLVDVSSDNGADWSELSEFDNLLCSSSSDGDHYTIFVRGAEGAAWRLRASDGDEDFTNNGGEITVKVYAGVTSIDPFVTCEDNYTNTQVTISDRSVPANMGNGVSIPAIVSGQVYSIEITGESAWFEDGDTSPLYLAEISDDGGANWEDLETYADATCASMVGNGGRWRVWFTAASGSYRLRVRDGDTNFLSNTGSILYRLYTSADTSSDAYYDNLPDPQWIVTCNEDYLRPDSLFSLEPLTIGDWDFDIPVPRVGDWLEYAKNAVVSFFSWCPQHTEYLVSIPASLESYEPFGTLAEVGDAFTAMQSVISGLSSGGAEDAQQFAPYSLIFNGGGGASGEGIGFSGFVPQASDSLLDADFTLDLSAVEAEPGALGGASADTEFVIYCENVYEATFGTSTGTFCGTVDLLRSGPLMNFLFIPMQFMLDVVAFVTFIAYLKRDWIDTGSMS